MLTQVTTVELLYYAKSLNLPETCRVWDATQVSIYIDGVFLKKSVCVFVRVRLLIVMIHKKTYE